MSFWKWWDSDPLPPPEPVYSELGIELWRLLEEKEGEWKVNHPHSGDDGIYHYKSGINLDLYPRGQKEQQLSLRIGTKDEWGSCRTHTLTADDIHRLRDRVIEIRNNDLKRRQYEDMKSALERIKPNPYDKTARELARAVLSGDMTAAEPLVDVLIELNLEGKR